MTSSTNRILELSSSIATNVAKINYFNEEHGLATQSFDPYAPPKYNYPPNIEDARQQALYATDELHALLAGPASVLTRPSHNAFTSIHAMYRFNIANSFPAGKEETTYDELAAACGLSEPSLRRIIRALMSHRIFRQLENGKIAHTITSKFFADNHTMRQWVGMVLEEMWPAATKLVDALEKWPNSNEPNETGFNLAHATDRPMLDVIGHNPLRAQRFAEAMSLFNTSSGMETKSLVDSYDWQALSETAIVVDVGGSHGDIAISLARKYPKFTCIVQDLPKVIASAKVPDGLEKQVSFMEHDFFVDQPVMNADVYFFKWIFHDWADKYCIRILKALIPALKKGARIVVNEFILPTPGFLPIYLETEIRSFDISMWEIQNGKEREVGDWAALFQAADSRLKLTNTIQPHNSKLGIIEAIWDI